MPVFRKKLHWWEPKEIFRPRLKTEFAFLSKQYRLAKLIPFTFLLALLTILIFKHLGEPVDAVFCLKVLCISTLPLALPWYYYFMVWLIPPLVNLSSKGLTIQRGNSTFCLPKDKIIAIGLDLSQPPAGVLTVQSGQMKREVGLSEKVDSQELLLSLVEWFPGVPIQCLDEALPDQHKATKTNTPNTRAPQEPKTTVALNHINAR